MDLNTQGNRKILIGHFPRLDNDKYYKILSEATPLYNCIAWAMGYKDRWVDIYRIPGHWWPDGVSRSTDPQSLIEAFVAESFEQVDNRFFEAGYDKVVLFQKDGMWTHASRILCDNTEYSKFGESFDGVHSCGVFADSIYGNEYAYMRRPVPDKQDRTMARGKIKINLHNLDIY